MAILGHYSAENIVSLLDMPLTVTTSVGSTAPKTNSNLNWRDTDAVQRLVVHNIIGAYLHGRIGTVEYHGRDTL